MKVHGLKQEEQSPLQAEQILGQESHLESEPHASCFLFSGTTETCLHYKGRHILAGSDRACSAATG